MEQDEKAHEQGDSDIEQCRADILRAAGSAGPSQSSKPVEPRAVVEIKDEQLPLEPETKVVPLMPSPPEQGKRVKRDPAQALARAIAHLKSEASNAKNEAEEFKARLQQSETEAEKALKEAGVK